MDAKRLTTDELAAVRARAEAAMPGRWERIGNTVYFGGSYFKEFLGDIPTADFIAHARADVPTLLAHIDALTDDRDALARALAEVRNELAALGRVLAPGDGRRERDQEHG